MEVKHIVFRIPHDRFRYIEHISLRKWVFINQEELFLLSISKKLVFFLKKNCTCSTRAPHVQLYSEFTAILHVYTACTTTSVIGKRFLSVMGECDRDTKGVSSIFKVIRSAADFRFCSTSDFVFYESIKREQYFDLKIKPELSEGARPSFFFFLFHCCRRNGVFYCRCTRQRIFE